MNLHEYTPTGRLQELNLIDLDEVIESLRLYLGNFLLDDDVAMQYVTRMVGDEGWAAHKTAPSWLAYVLSKVVELHPFDVRGLNLYCRLVDDPAAALRLKKISRMDVNSRIWDLTGCLGSDLKASKTRIMLSSILKAAPGNVLAAAQLLRLEALLGTAPGEWLAGFTPPPFVAEDWERHLFVHYATLGYDEQGRQLYERLSLETLNTTQLNAAAEMWVRSRQVAQGLDCYERSLELDPVQQPIRRRVAELRQPSQPDSKAVPQHDVCICLYSWNKADYLERTLSQLAATDIGPAKVRVLLNGCTDGSGDVAAAAKALFPQTDYEVIELPVNVGAPAARNWLLALPEVQGAEFVAFLDDDVDLPPNWLAHFLAVMDRFPKTAVVGAKVVFAGKGLYQYLYRRQGIAKPGLFKLTDTCPIACYDTGLYDVITEADAVMGCCHLLRVAALKDAPWFDIRFSPSQVDDTAHDLELRLAGWEVRYCGLVTCVHHQNSGANFAWSQSEAALGNVLGNDLKLYYSLKKRLPQLGEIRRQQLDAAPDL